MHDCLVILEFEGYGGPGALITSLPGSGSKAGLDVSIQYRQRECIMVMGVSMLINYIGCCCIDVDISLIN